MHPGVVKEGDSKYVSTDLGRLLIANSVTEIDALAEEIVIDRKITAFIEREGVIDEPGILMDAIRECFIENFDEGSKNSDLMRLRHPAALRFYAMLLDWKLKQYSVKEAIRLTLRYWDALVSSGRGDYVYVGTWGDTKYGESNREYWVKLSAKSDTERINLAIVRLKEEDDFFDHKIFRFLEILNGLGVVDASFYKRVRYGTDDDVKIKMMREGFSRGLVDLILSKYLNMIKVPENGDVEIDPRLVSAMISEKESDLVVFEAQMNIKSLQT